MDKPLMFMRRHEDRIRMRGQGNDAANAWVMDMERDGTENLLTSLTAVHRAASAAYSTMRTEVLKLQLRDLCDDNATGRVFFEAGFTGLVVSLVEQQERHVWNRTRDALAAKAATS